VTEVWVGRQYFREYNALAIVDAKSTVPPVDLDASNRSDPIENTVED
jgi:hypothetical protein